MPELPEVETSRLGITPHLKQEVIEEIVIRVDKLRWPIPQELQRLVGQSIISIERRAKYLLIETAAGTAIVHLGMSGSLRIVDKDHPTVKHDHVDLVIQTGKALRYNDPRKFGSWLYSEVGELHPVLSKLGPEPLTNNFNADYLMNRMKSKRAVAKQFIMNNDIVVGVGNIYANEALFAAKIHPKTPVYLLDSKQVALLVDKIKKILTQAIKQGGTTLKDFTQVDGKPGYFSQKLHVYGRGGEPCNCCGSSISQEKIGQRNSFWCEMCQSL